VKIKIYHLLFLVTLICLLPAFGWADEAGLVDRFVEGFERYALNSPNHYSVLVAIAAATLISEDLACIAAGLLAAKGMITPVSAVAASGLGIYIGDVLLYLSGYLVGLTALKHAPLKWFISENAVRQSKRLFEQQGSAIIVTSRFLPGTRTATFFAAGLVQMNMAKLLIYFGLAVIIWTPILVLGSMAIGRQAVVYVETYSSHAFWVFLGLLLLLFLATRLIVPLFSWRGRRLLISKWRRVSRWEFWPYYVTNAVTFLYVLYLGCIKYRQLTLFTVVNPAMKPDSGFIGERKSSILRGLPEEFVGKWQLVHAGLSLEQKKDLLRGFLAAHSLDYPVVLKPDRGCRGQGVEICKTSREADVWLKRVKEDFIIMEYLPGEEFGVFYYRLPLEPTGKIFSITRKKLIAVTGDGSHTLEELILLDERALCMAPTFLANLHQDLLRVIPDGEQVPLVQVGTHSRGSLFLDGAQLATPELLKAIEVIVRPYKGFFFGRFDLKVPNEDELRSGNNLKVIELNGVTSEATHIYDPNHSVVYAWKTLMKQWTLAFQIAAMNQQQGSRPMTLRSFIRHWIRAGR
jgi:membrane protein DedA with SNARE-associated domain